MPVTDVTTDIDTRTITITARFAAPPERVWALYADPRQLEQVWGPPQYPATFVEQVSEALTAAGIEHGRATRQGLRQPVTIVPVGMVKGLEVDASVVVEPTAIVDEEAQGLRALYVALTRATKRSFHSR